MTVFLFLTLAFAFVLLSIYVTASVIRDNKIVVIKQPSVIGVSIAIFSGLWLVTLMQFISSRSLLAYLLLAVTLLVTYGSFILVEAHMSKTASRRDVLLVFFAVAWRQIGLVAILALMAVKAFLLLP